MHWRFLAACFVVLGGGVSLLHALKRVADLPDWAVACSIAGFSVILLVIQRIAAQHTSGDSKPNA
jgi:hypothetical protein